MLNETEMQEVERRCEAATPGPWQMNEVERLLASFWETGNRDNEAFIWRLIGSWCYGAFYYASQIGNHDDAGLFLSATEIADCRSADLLGGDRVS